NRHRESDDPGSRAVAREPGSESGSWSRSLSGGGDQLGDDAVLLVEVLLVGHGPTTEVLVDGQQRRGCRERVAGVVRTLDVDLDALVEGTEALLGVVGLA